MEQSVVEREMTGRGTDLPFSGDTEKTMEDLFRLLC